MGDKNDYKTLDEADIPLLKQLTQSTNISTAELLQLFLKKELKCTYRRILSPIVEVLNVAFVTVIIYKFGHIVEDIIGDEKIDTLKFEVQNSFDSDCSFTNNNTETFNPFEYKTIFKDCSMQQGDVNFLKIGPKTEYEILLTQAGQSFFGPSPFQSTVLPTLDLQIYASYVANRAFTVFFSKTEWILSIAVLQPLVNGTSGTLIFLQIMQYLYLAIFGITMAFTISHAMAEKENSIHSYMIVMGLPRYTYYASHFVTATIKIWLYSIPVFSVILAVESPVFDKTMFAVLFTYAHFIVYSGICMTTLTSKATYAILLTFVYHGLLMASYYTLGFSIFESFKTSMIMLFHPFLALQATLENLYLHCFYSQDHFSLANYDFYVPFLVTVAVMVMHVFGAVFLTFYLDKKLSAHTTNNKTLTESRENIHYIGEQEEISSNMTPGIIINDVTKRWDNGEVAVNHASFVAYKNQVTGLLGHNGAGKSTIFGCLTGLITPTSGKIEIVHNGNPDVNHSIGFCPQWDPLFPLLTVVEHLNFYGTIKTGKSIKAEVMKSVIENIGLIGSENVQARNLSGGQKRKLSVGIALIGESGIILLDEPTAGMDPMARHNMVQIIKRIQNGRTVLLTTHYMDEAEAVANRVVILAKGEVDSSGSIEFLKQKFATGFLLTVVLAESEKATPVDKESTANSILEMVKQYCPTAVIRGKSCNQFVILLPLDFKTKIPDIFKTLEEQQDQKIISSFGIDVNSLEQVFQKINENANLKNPNEDTCKTSDVIRVLSDKSNSKWNTLRQVLAMMLRRLHYARRHYVLSCAPCVLLIALIAFGYFNNCTEVVKDSSPDAILERHIVDTNLANGPKMTIVLVDPPSQYMDDLNGIKMQMTHPNINFVHVDESDALNTSESWYSKQPTFGFQLGITDDNGNPHYQLLYRNAFPTAPLIVQQAIARHYLNGTGGSITGTFYSSSLDVDLFVYFVIAALASVVITSIVFAAPIFLYSFEENGARQLYRLAGVPTPVYWFVAYVSEMLLAAIPCVLLIVVHLQLETYKTSDLHIVAGTYFFYGLAYISQMFCAVKFFDSSSIGFIALLIYNALIGSIVIVFDTFKIPNFETFLNISRYLFPSLVLKKDKHGIATYESVTDCIPAVLIYFELFVTISFIKDYGEYAVHFLKPSKDTNASKKAEGIITAKNLSKTYRTYLLPSAKKAVKNITFGVKNCECFGLLGANGAGKSTTFSMLTGDSVPTSGEAVVDNRSVNNFFNVYNYPKFGYCPQHNVLLGDLSVKETFTLFCRLSGRVDVQKCVHSLFELLKLNHVKNNCINNCSGGEKRRIAVGVALITNPKIIMLDEPTAGIDPLTRRRVWDLLIGLRNSGTTEILSSHSMEECETLCTRMAIMSDGEIRAEGTSQDLKTASAHSYILKLIVTNSEAISNVITAVQSIFKNATFDNVTGSNIVLSIPKSNRKLSDVYNDVISFVNARNIKEYSLTDGSLEQVFVGIAGGKKLMENTTENHVESNKKIESTKENEPNIVPSPFSSNSENYKLSTVTKDASSRNLVCTQQPDAKLPLTLNTLGNEATKMKNDRQKSNDKMSSESTKEVICTEIKTNTSEVPYTEDFSTESKDSGYRSQ